MLTKLKYLQTPFFLIELPVKPEKVLAVYAGKEEVVSWLAQCLHDVPHLERDNI